VPAGKSRVDNWYHGYTVPTPATDGKHVFALFGSGVLVSLDFDGKAAWRDELPGLKNADSGICSSPVLYEDTIIIPGNGDAGLRALEKATGKLKWEQKTRERNRMATPALLHIGGRTELVHYAGGIQSLDPATGETLWVCKGVNTSQSSPVFGSGLLYTDAGRGGQYCNAVDATGTGDVTTTHVKWKEKTKTAAGSSGIVVGDYVYRASEPGLIICRELKTGTLVYEERTPRISPSASPIACADGRIYFASPGKTYVIQAGPKFELLATNDLNDGPDYPTPAVSAGRLFIKGKSYLWCIGAKERK
jgi:outer membrane protein assembly factor BamB